MKGLGSVLFAVLFSVIAYNGQTRPGTAGTSETSNQPRGAITVAVIDSAAYADEKVGIARVSAAMKQVNDKFVGADTELKGLQGRLCNLQADIEKKRATESPAVISQLTEQAKQLQVQITRKGEDANQSYQKQMGDALTPLQADVGNALKTYAAAHGILIIIDLNRTPLIYAHDSVDITKDFIADYNRTHPVGATAPATRP